MADVEKVLADCRRYAMTEDDVSISNLVSQYKREDPKHPQDIYDREVRWAARVLIACARLVEKKDEDDVPM